MSLGIRGSTCRGARGEFSQLRGTIRFPKMTSRTTLNPMENYTMNGAGRRMYASCMTLAALAATLLLTGCAREPGAASGTAGGPAAAKGDDAKIEAALAKLSPEDRKIAEQQKFCAVSNKSRLGGMGTPVKL